MRETKSGNKQPEFCLQRVVACSLGRFDQSAISLIVTEYLNQSIWESRTNDGYYYYFVIIRAQNRSIRQPFYFFLSTL